MAAPPYSKPRSVKRKILDVIFYVTAAGQVDRERTLIGIQLPNGYREEFIKTLTMWRFAPAVHASCAVPATATAILTLATYPVLRADGQ